MHSSFLRGSSAAVVVAGLMLGGCATTESVQHAQATADSAKADAADAMAAARKAQGSADDAGKSARDAMTLAQTANDRIDRLVAEMRAHTKHAMRRHRRHVASAAAAACPPQQKTENVKPHNKTAALQRKHMRYSLN